MTSHNQNKPFRLLDLPAEIWAKIGRLAIDDEEQITERDFSIWAIVVGDRIGDMPQQPSITKACRALREELLPYYHQHKVDIDLTPVDGSEEACDRWLCAVGAGNRCRVRGVYLFEEADRVKNSLEILTETWKLNVVTSVGEETWRGKAQWYLRILS